MDNDKQIGTKLPRYQKGMVITMMPPSPNTLTVATYNICHGHYANFDWQRLTAPIRACGADMVGIQEVDMYTARSRHMDSVAALAEAAELPYTLFAATMPFESGHYGTAILSRYPIASSVVVPLDAGEYEPRAFGCVRVSLPDGAHLYLLNTHLSYKSAACRRGQFRALREWMETHIPKDSPCLLTGDFNTECDEDYTPLLALGMSALNVGRRYVSFRNEPLAIDNIVYTPDQLSPVESGMVESDASDHNLLWCRFSRR